ncbi:AraC family transcriptional regulator [Caballeronia glebae]|jgi:AraC-like DNA-binding protein|uniref:AraC family transcriptional regulator n=1 Tax=Caballeronia glebae TaxID=1777143 RepID=A0A157ZEB2_9BURK|nr:helix-turn-helix domain-containing protein [Caballeronia glebae]SAK43912.1 AraC family transcriptional regulator [Caballeronia glebae]
MPADSDPPKLSTRFSTLACPRERQLLAWRDRVGHVIDVVPDKDQIARGFAGSIDLHAAGGLVFTQARTDALVLERSIARVSTDMRRDFAFHVYAEGETGHVSGLSVKRSAPGSVRGIIAFDLNQRFRIERPACRVLTMFVPRAIVAAHIGDCEALHGRVLPEHAPLARFVFEHFDVTARELPALERPDAIDVLDAGAQLLLAAFADKPHALSDSRAALQTAVKRQVKRYIEARLHEADLTPTTIVEALGLKRATVYRWFEQEGGLAAYIRHRRLREAADELARFPNLQIADIAFGLGFKSASDFTRAFRRAFDVSPLEMRLRALDLLRATTGDPITRMRAAHSKGVPESG